MAERKRRSRSRGSRPGSSSAGQRSALRRAIAGIFTDVKNTILAIGALASAVGAVWAFVPKGGPTPVALEASLDNVSVLSGISLEEYEHRFRADAAGIEDVAFYASDSSSQSTGLSVSSTTSQKRYSASSETAPATTPERTSAPERTNTPETTPSETTPDGAPPSTGATPTSGATGTKPEKTIGSLAPTKVFHREGDSLVLSGTGAPSGKVDETLHGVANGGASLLSPREATSPGGQTIESIALPDTCGSSCAAKSTVDHVLADSSPGEAAKRVAMVFAGSRGRVIGHTLHPIGVAVSYMVHLTGFAGSRAIMEWSLWSRSTGRPLAKSWWRQVIVKQVKPMREKQSVAVDFWAPIPWSRGSYVFHLTVKDGSGADYAERETLPPFH